MKRIIYLFTTALLLSVMSGCSDEFLTNSPIGGESEVSFYKNDDQMFNALMAAYDPLQWTYGSNHFIPFAEIRSDNANTGGGGPSDYLEYQEMEDFINADDNAISNNFWKVAYAGIYRSNIVMEKALDTDLSKVFTAEAKVLRAWYHFDMLRTYGPCVISLQSVYPLGYQFARSSREDVNKQIEKDLLEAIPVLETSHPDAMLGRITKSAAQALLAKVYIYWADWENDNKAIFDKAVPLLEAVMGAGYELSSDYSSLFAPLAENNKESIWEVQHSTKQGTGSWSNVGVVGEANFWVQFGGPRGLGNHPQIDGGWGLSVQRQDFYDYFLEEDSVRRKASFFSYDDLVTIPNAGGASVEWNTGAYGDDFEGYCQRKYTSWNNTAYTDMAGSPLLNRPGNERILRYGEIYLLLAECHLRGTVRDEAAAKDLIDELRLHHIGKGVQANVMTVDELMADNPTRFPNVLEVLWYERRCELAGEGDRWFDLVRTGRAAQIMGALYPDAWEAKHHYIPVSQVETGASGGSISAYPDEAEPTPPVY